MVAAVPGLPYPVGAPTGPPAAVYPVGGDLLTALLPAAVTVVDRLSRVQPNSHFYNVVVGRSPERPYSFDIMTFRVPASMHYWVFDFDFAIYRPSGVDPSDFFRAEEGRFSNSIFFNIDAAGKHLGDLRSELEPIPIQQSRMAFETSPSASAGGGIGIAPAGTGTSAAQFRRVQAQSFASATNAALAALPVRRGRFGPTMGPVVLVLDTNQNLTLQGHIIRAFPSPIYAVEGRHTGYLVPSTVSQKLQREQWRY